MSLAMQYVADITPNSFLSVAASPASYTLSLHDALPILMPPAILRKSLVWLRSILTHVKMTRLDRRVNIRSMRSSRLYRSEEHTSELQSRQYLVCRLLLEKKKQTLGGAHEAQAQATAHRI